MTNSDNTDENTPLVQRKTIIEGTSEVYEETISEYVMDPETGKYKETTKRLRGKKLSLGLPTMPKIIISIAIFGCVQINLKTQFSLSEILALFYDGIHTTLDFGKTIEPNILDEVTKPAQTGDDEQNINEDASEYIVITAPTDVQFDFDLPDHTHIILEPGSIIRFPRLFKGKKREIEILKGDADFDVYPDDNKPFIILKRKV